MEKKVDKTEKSLRIICFSISCILVLSGAINLGKTEILPSLPFIWLIVYLARTDGGNYVRVGMVILLCSLFLRFAGQSQRSFFYPANGRTVTLVNNVCVTTIANAGIIYGEMKDPSHGKCAAHLQGHAISSELIPRGTKLKVLKTTVSHSDMRETYMIELQGGAVAYHRDFSNLIWENGNVVRERDLRNPFLYNFSMLMYWPYFAWALDDYIDSLDPLD